MVGLTPKIKRELEESKEICVGTFTPERVEALREQIKRAYKPGVGIKASTLCNILFGYTPGIVKYEGIAYYLFNLVATRSKTNRSRKGSLFFAYTDDALAGRISFPIVSNFLHVRGDQPSNSSSNKGNISKCASALFEGLSKTYAELAKIFS